MPIPLIMPQFGEGVNEGLLVKWLKTVGDRVEKHEPLAEFTTDKVNVEVPSPADGVLLDILIPEDTTVQVGTVLAHIGETSEAPVPSSAPPEKPSSVREMASPPAAEKAPAGFISPIVSRIAAEQGVDLAQVPGSGLGGRITKNDVLAFVQARQAAPEPPPPIVSAPPLVAAPPALSEEPPLIAPAKSPETVLPLTPLRRAIADHMLLSRRTSPHATTVMEADVSRVTAHRLANKDSFARDGANLTFTAYFIAAAAVALRAYPLVNSSWGEDGIHLHSDIHIGVAASLGETGLIVPVIQRAGELSLLGIARRLQDLVARARSRQLTPAEVRGGTFTITNHGVSGSLFAAPIINQPQCAILGVGKIQKRVVVISDANGNDGIAIRPMVYLSLTFDHRILDGATADSFLGKVVEYLESWQ